MHDGLDGVAGEDALKVGRVAEIARDEVASGEQVAVTA